MKKFSAPARKYAFFYATEKRLCEKSRIRETLYLSTFTDVMCHISSVMCYVSPITCRVSPVTCHLSLTPTATAPDPPPAHSPTMLSKLCCKDPKNPKKLNAKNHQNSKKPKTAPETAQLVVLFLAQDLLWLLYYVATADGGVGQLEAVGIRFYHQGVGWNQ